MNQPVTPFPAATVAICRDTPQGIEVLLLKRAAEIKFAGGAWVFPGGRVDPEDYTHKPEDFESALRQAAVRECKEEAGLIIDPDQLVPCGHWITPVIRPKRFDTYFYLYELNDNKTVTIDDYEIVEYQWLLASDAITAHYNQQLFMLAPNFITLLELANCSTVSAAKAFYTSRPIRSHKPKWIAKEGKNYIILYEEDAGYAEGIADHNGPKHRAINRNNIWEYISEF